MYLYKSPEAQTPMRRRTSQHIAHKRPDEGIPFMDEMYKKSDQLTKGIYRVTIKAREIYVCVWLFCCVVGISSFMFTSTYRTRRAPRRGRRWASATRASEAGRIRDIRWDVRG